MAIDNFKPTIWSALIIDSLRKSLVFGDVANRNYEGEIRNGGEKVKILEIGDITVSDYSGTVSYQDIQDASKYLLIDQKKYFAFNLDDVDKAQSSVDVMVRATEKASYKLRDTADQFIAGLYGEAGVTSGLGTTASPLTVTSAGASSTTSVKTLFSTIAKELDEANCPTEGRWIVVPPWLHQKILLAEDARLTVENPATTNGRVGTLWGFDVRMSNNVATASSGTVYKVMAGTSEAISYADQLVKIEALRRDASFAEGVRGLHVYGGKVVQNDALAVASVSEGTT